ncbi:hypothetical protein RJ639_022195 [Escallonia herrerae]|uniref:Reverse transcriptase Ty1/copia-type domain-containing protein n=1 Tax=Escallonia herrerae TaxID=1293975 RepID=A0AA89AH09_9ASTE|nr:hypothetical protein RJ639_022195 [Escallonia herrerae]
MAKEISALEANQTWTLQPLPPGKLTIDSKWVYKVKYHPDKNIKHYKACLIAKGYTQIEGIDFNERFAQVAKLVTICSAREENFFAVVQKKGKKLLGRVGSK